MSPKILQSTKGQNLTSDVSGQSTISSLIYRQHLSDVCIAQGFSFLPFFLGEEGGLLFFQRDAATSLLDLTTELSQIYLLPFLLTPRDQGSA